MILSQAQVILLSMPLNPLRSKLVLAWQDFQLHDCAWDATQFAVAVILSVVVFTDGRGTELLLTSLDHKESQCMADLAS